MYLKFFQLVLSCLLPLYLMYSLVLFLLRPTSKLNHLILQALPSLASVMAFTLGRDEPNGLVRDARRAATPDSLRYCPIDDQDGRNLTRSRRSYFSDAFSLREVYNSPREQINNRSSVIVEIKTNVKVSIDWIPI